MLDLLCQEGAKFGTASPTRVASRANIPYNRFQKIIDHFIKADMVRSTDQGLLITETGLKCMRQIQRTNELLRRMGLET